MRLLKSLVYSIVCIFPSEMQSAFCITTGLRFDQSNCYACFIYKYIVLQIYLFNLLQTVLFSSV